MRDVVRVQPEIADALAEGRPVAALESTIVSHSLPRPENLTVAQQAMELIREQGAVPALIAVVDGRACIGVSPSELESLASDPNIEKITLRDLPAAITGRRTGGTTVAATAHLAHLAGVRVFATGALGGVHRQAKESWDESADLPVLSQLPMVVVSAGVKSMLDVGATLERLETYSIGLVGFGTDRFPGFYLSDSGFPVPWRMDTVADVARTVAARDALNVRQALVVANPLPADEQIDPDEHDRVLEEGLSLVRSRGIGGKDVTPFLVDHFHRATAGASLEANVRVVIRNSSLAAQLAVALRDKPGTDDAGASGTTH